jgi:hypothetical protein
MEKIDLEKLKRANSIIPVAIELGIKVRGNMGKCFKTERHTDDNEELTLFFNPAQNSFFCKDCEDVGGSVINLVCQYKGWEQKKAVDWLAHRHQFDQMTQKRYHGKGIKKFF